MDYRTRKYHARSRLERDAKAAVIEAAGQLLTSNEDIAAKLLTREAGRISELLLKTIGRNWRFVSRSRQQITIEEN